MSLTAPAAVRAALRRGLQLVRDGHAGRGLRGETVRWAERIADGDPITREKAVKMRAWFARHGVARAESARRMRDPQSPAAVAWLTWGGTPSIPYRASGWRDPVAAWLRDVLATFERQRPARRSVSNGRRIAVERSNVVVDASGRPIPVFHGTNARFHAFDHARIGTSVDAGTLGTGFYFTDYIVSAESYATWVANRKGGVPVVVEANIRITKPYLVTRANAPRNLENDPKAAARFTKSLQRQGYDGVIHTIDLSMIDGVVFREYVAFDASQVTITGHADVRDE